MKLEDLNQPEFANLKECLDEFLEPQFIEPLKKLGFEFEEYYFAGNDEMGTHNLIFREANEFASILGRADDYEALEEICSQDDDGQPSATHRYYCGTLFVYIPYFC